MRLNQSPYHLLLFTGFLLVFILFFLNRNSTVDIDVHDTYYVIDYHYFLLLLAFVVWALWLLYMLTRNVLYSKLLTWTHVTLTMLTVLFLLILLHPDNGTLKPQQGRYLDLSAWKSFDEHHLNLRWIVYVAIALVAGQVTFVVNVVAGLIKRFR